MPVVLSENDAFTTPGSEMAPPRVDGETGSGYRQYAVGRPGRQSRYRPVCPSWTDPAYTGLVRLREEAFQMTAGSGTNLTVTMAGWGEPQSGLQKMSIP